jgi:ornithine cyclodeaminase/alanine dehydrogenase-like protein (mu-crystallin family)
MTGFMRREYMARIMKLAWSGAASRPRLADGMRVVSAHEIRDAIGAHDLVRPTREAFEAVSAGRARTTFGLLDLDAGDVQIKAGHVAGDPWFVVKVASWVPAGSDGAVTDGGLLVCSASTGAPVAYLADEHFLTDVRTAAAGALATDLLARDDADRVAVLGGGTQAELQVLALDRLRPLRRVVVWARRPRRAEELAQRLRARLPQAVTGTAASPAEAAAVAGIVITATAAHEPLLEAADLRDGHHVTALGADDARKRELAEDCFARAATVAVDSRAQSCELAELAGALRRGVLRREDIVEIGEITAGRARGRRDGRDVTIAKLSGLAVQDLAAARVTLAAIGWPAR